MLLAGDDMWSYYHIWSRQKRSRKASPRTKRRLSGNRPNYPAGAYAVASATSTVSGRNLFERDSCIRRFPERRRRMVAAGSGRSPASRPTPTDKAAVDWRAWFSALTRSANTMSWSLIRSPLLSSSNFRLGLHMQAPSVCTSSRSPVQHRGVGSSDNPNIGGSQ